MRRAFGVVIARVRVGCTKRRRSPFMYVVVVVVVAACGGRCEGEGEVDEATALTAHVRRCHRCCRRVWRDEVVGYSEGGCDVRLASSLRG